jgi:hypothetical protein
MGTGILKRGKLEGEENGERIKLPRKAQEAERVKRQQKEEEKILKEEKRKQEAERLKR